MFTCIQRLLLQEHPPTGHVVPPVVPPVVPLVVPPVVPL